MFELSSEINKKARRIWSPEYAKQKAWGENKYVPQARTPAVFNYWHYLYK